MSSENPFWRLSGIIHAILVEHPGWQQNFAELTEEAKCRAARKAVPYNSDMVRRAVDSETFKRRNGVTRCHARNSHTK